MNSIETQVASDQANGSLWLIVVFVGAFVLVAAMTWARMKNKKISREQEHRSEEATRDLYRQEAEDRTRRGD